MCVFIWFSMRAYVHCFIKKNVMEHINSHVACPPPSSCTGVMYSARNALTNKEPGKGRARFPEMKFAKISSTFLTEEHANYILANWYQFFAILLDNLNHRGIHAITELVIYRFTLHLKTCESRL